MTGDDLSPDGADDQPFLSAAQMLGRHMLASMDFARADRLWPSDAMIFQTNPLSVAHGACGTALFVHHLLGELPVEVRDWLVARPIDVKTYPPGLFTGLAGIAWTFAEFGMVERAIEILDLVPTSPLAFASPDIFHGCAGWGLAALAFYLRTHDDRFLVLASRAADAVLETAQYDEAGMFWREDPIRLGFALGASGIALFLLYTWRLTGNDRYLRAAHDAIAFDVAHGQENRRGLVWGMTTEDRGHREYWLRGGAGVATALVRFATLLGDERYLELARRATDPCDTFFSAAPHLFEGLAGMGESLLDLYLVTGDERYWRAARLKGEQTLLFKVQRGDDALAFPGRYLLRLSHDYGVGGAGVGLYLLRLARKGTRPFHDIFGPLEMETRPDVARAPSMVPHPDTLVAVP